MVVDSRLTFLLSPSSLCTAQLTPSSALHLDAFPSQTLRHCTFSHYGIQWYGTAAGIRTEPHACALLLLLYLRAASVVFTEVFLILRIAVLPLYSNSSLGFQKLLRSSLLVAKGTTFRPIF